jgi:hypothetical protein
MKRTITRFVEDGVSDALISGFLNNEKATLEIKGDDILLIRNGKGEVKEHEIVKTNGIGASQRSREEEDTVSSTQTE